MRGKKKGMGKGRKSGSDRNERLLGTFVGDRCYGSSTMDASEFREEDVWGIVNDDQMQHQHDAPSEWCTSTNDDRRIRNHVGGLSLALNDVSLSGKKGGSSSSRIVQQEMPRRGHRLATSVPMNTPDWNKIVRVGSVESYHDSDDGFDEHDLGKVPPHEYLARSRSKTATSVFEGLGRTLKGRDMSRVRDAVWSQTGFDG